MSYELHEGIKLFYISNVFALRETLSIKVSKEELLLPSE